MKTLYYHESFEYQEDYDFNTLGKKGITVTSKRIVCPTCNGTGSHFRTDLDENSLVQSIMEDGDDDGYNAYRNGAFDQGCTECNGNNVIEDVDWDTVPKWASDCISEWEEDKAHDERVRYAENGYR